MISKRDILLVLDTSILTRMFSENKPSTIEDCLKNWLQASINSSDCSPDRRRILFAVSTSMFADYRTGFGKCGHGVEAVNALEMAFDRSSTVEIPIATNKGRVFLVLLKVLKSSLPSEEPLSDKFDTKILVLSKAVLRARKLSNRGFIFAIDDEGSRIELADRIGQDPASRDRSYSVVADVEKMAEALTDP